MNRGKSVVLASTLCCAALGLSTHAETAWAQPEGAEAETVQEDSAESPRKMDVSVPAPGERVRRSAYVHEGFYLRVNAGPGWQWTSFNDRGALDADLSGNSFALAADVMVGASPSPGIALGLGLLTNTAFDMDLEDRGQDLAQTNAGHFIIGPFFDAFPDNRAGWHLGAELGFAMSLFDEDPQLASSAIGGGAAAWVGHDWWVAPEWSTGLMLRVSGAYLFGSEDEIDARSTAVTTSLLVTLLYN